MEDRPLDEGRLIERAKDGDIDAYGQLMRTHQDVGFRVAYLITQSAADAEDAVQEAFFQAHRALHRFRRGAAFRPWFLRIVANEAKDRRQANRRRGALALRLAGTPASGDTAPSPEAALVASAERARVIEALNRMPERDRLVIAYRYLLDLPEADIAAALGCARGTVKSRLSRALERLRALVEEPG